MSWLMRLTDLAASLLFCAAAYYLVFRYRPPPPNVLYYQIAVILSILLQILVFHALDLYRSWRGEDYLREFTAVLLAWTTVFAVLVFLSVITKTSASFSRAWLLMWFTAGGSAILLMRFSLRQILRLLRARGFNLRQVAVIGSGEVGRRVLDALLNAQETGFQVCAYFSDRDDSIGLPQRLTRGVVAEAGAFLQRSPVDQVWLAMPLSEESRIERILGELRDCTADIRLVPDLFGIRLINHSVSSIAGLSVINLSISPMDGVNRWVKAAEDFLLAGTILALVSPLLLLIAVLVRLDSPGPAIYRQKRLSWNGREFEMYKFRTMPVDAEAWSGPVWATSGEKRATRVGALLRRTSLDELPQFWNVLKGDMSIVGPRPERPVFVGRFRDQIPSYMQKHMVKAGITGWAQVNGWRGDTDIQARIEHDLFYIEHWSIWLDLKIILMTIFRGFIHKNAY